MFTITKEKLYRYCRYGNDVLTYREFAARQANPLLTAEEFAKCSKLDLRIIFCQQDLGCRNPSFKELCDVVEQVLAATNDGREIITWYGGEAEVLVVAYYSDELTIADKGTSNIHGEFTEECSITCEACGKSPDECVCPLPGF